MRTHMAALRILTAESGLIHYLFTQSFCDVVFIRKRGTGEQAFSDGSQHGSFKFRIGLYSGY